MSPRALTIFEHYVQIIARTIQLNLARLRGAKSGGDGGDGHAEDRAHEKETRGHENTWKGSQAVGNREPCYRHHLNINIPKYIESNKHPQASLLCAPETVTKE